MLPLTSATGTWIRSSTGSRNSIGKRRDGSLSFFIVLRHYGKYLEASGDGMDLSSDSPDGIKSYPSVALLVDAELMPHFLLLLQQGVRIRSRIGCSISLFLREELGATPATIEKIQSIILDGKPVDDIEDAMLKQGSVLALSAAMPGLVGATLRRGGAYSSLRSAITYHENKHDCSPGEGVVSIKLFNLLIAELGPGLLQKGIIISPVSLFSFIAEQLPDLWEHCRQATLDGRSVPGSELAMNPRLKAQENIHLSVTPA